MFLNEEFLHIYEELSNLNEAKADTEKLINFAGEELANKFLALKSKLKAPENDLYYWIKKTPEELEAFLAKIEQKKSNTQIKKEVAGRGAKLVCSTQHWDVYSITTYEAAQAYGRDTKWCITGINNWGDSHWQDYKYQRGVDFYFLITKENYDPRAMDSKFAIAIYPDGETYEAFNQKDGQVLIEDIKYIDEVKIPGVDLWALESRGPHCSVCDDYVFNEEGQYDSFNNLYCPTCWNNELHEWVDKSGNKINLNTTAVSASNTSSSSYKKRFEKLIKYHIDHASSELESITKKDIKDYGFHLGEHYNTGLSEFDRDIIASADKNTGTLSFSIFVDGKEVCRRQCKDYEEFFNELGDSYMYLTYEGTPDYDDLLIEWVDAKGNKISTTASTTGTANSGNSSTTGFKKRFDKLINYYGQHLPAEVDFVYINLLTKDTLDFTENFSDGDKARFNIFIDPTTEAWKIKYSVNGKLIDDISDKGWPELLKTLYVGYIDELPYAGTPEYNSLLTESLS